MVDGDGRGRGGGREGGRERGRRGRGWRTDAGLGSTHSNAASCPIIQNNTPARALSCEYPRTRGYSVHSESLSTRNLSTGGGTTQRRGEVDRAQPAQSKTLPHKWFCLARYHPLSSSSLNRTYTLCRHCSQYATQQPCATNNESSRGCSCPTATAVAPSAGAAYALWPISTTEPQLNPTFFGGPRCSQQGRA